MEKIHIMDNNFKRYFLGYVNSLCNSLMNANIKKINKSVELIINQIKKNKTVYVCGNGGSAAIANHYVCDFSKLLRQNTNLKAKFVSLSSNIEVITAISNDISYDQIFKYQAETYIKKGDLIILISASGNSKNIIELAKWAKQQKIKTISFTGFNGGKLIRLSDININIKIDNYGKTEDSHHILMHIIMQYLIDKFKKIKNPIL